MTYIQETLYAIALFRAIMWKRAKAGHISLGVLSLWFRLYLWFGMSMGSFGAGGLQKHADFDQSSNMPNITHKYFKLLYFQISSSHKTYGLQTAANFTWIDRKMSSSSMVISEKTGRVWGFWSQHCWINVDNLGCTVEGTANRNPW